MLKFCILVVHSLKNFFCLSTKYSLFIYILDILLVLNIKNEISKVGICHPVVFSSVLDSLRRRSNCFSYELKINLNEFC